MSFNQSSHPVTNDLVGFFQLAQVFINITADNCQSILHTTYLNIQVSDNCELPVKLTLVIPTIALFIIPFAFIPIWILLNITLRFIFSQQFLISVIVLLLLPPTLQLFYIHVLLNVAIYSSVNPYGKSGLLFSCSDNTCNIYPVLIQSFHQQIPLKL